jgi:ribosomal subunit interface protein
VDIIFKGRHTDVQERFRERVTAKLSKIGKLDHHAIRIDVEVCAEHNPRQADRRERVELTITSRGPAIRAEAAGQDRFAALDLALAKLESQLRRVGDRRKARRTAPFASGPGDLATDEFAAPPADAPKAQAGPEAGAAVQPAQSRSGDAKVEVTTQDDVVPIEMEGDGPLVVREKFHLAQPMAIDQALFEMELVGHDFFLFRDVDDGCPSVVYRRRGYQYGVIRLVEEPAAGRPRSGSGPVDAGADGQLRRAAGRPPRRTSDAATG